MLIKTADELNKVIKKIIIKAGADNRNAELLSKSLVSSHLSGVDTHGIRFLPLYIEQIKSGELIPNAWPEIIKETKNTVLVKGNYTFGQVTAAFAMNLAIKKAVKFGISIVGGVQVTHTGRIGEYVEMATKRKMIAFIFTGGLSEETPVAVPYGGSKSVLHTNPFAIGFPTVNNKPI
ncbi:MAG: Ldh family oxidoreductase, partial [Actinobacteria bacterium]|nr:Ldh family oxidoreductase [Actinomycetota bacterium]